MSTALARRPMFQPVRARTPFACAIAFAAAAALWSACEPAARAQTPPPASMAHHPRWVASVAFRADGKLLATAGGETLLYRPGEVRTWNPADGKPVAEFKGHESTVFGVAFSPDGGTLASCSYGKEIKLWDVASGKEKDKLPGGHANWVTALAFAPNGKLLATASEDAAVKVWDLEGKKEQATLKGHGSMVRCLTFTNDSARIITGSSDNTIRIWTVADQKETAKIDNAHTDGVWSVALNKEGTALASGGGDLLVKLWNPADGKPQTQLKGHKNWVTTLAFSSTGQLASGSYDRTVILWDIAGAKPAATLDGFKSSVWSIAFSPDGKQLAAGSHNDSLKLFDLASKKELYPPPKTEEKKPEAKPAEKPAEKKPEEKKP